MSIKGTQARAARILVQWPRAHVARLARIEEEVLSAFETNCQPLDAEETQRLRHVLETGGAVFLPEDDDGGMGVRLKFPSKDVRAIDRMENEGGAYGSDDI